MGKPKPKKGPKVLNPKSVCQRCMVKNGRPLHSCPLNGVEFGETTLLDESILCNCCGSCEHGCVMEV